MKKAPFPPPSPKGKGARAGRSALNAASGKDRSYSFFIFAFAFLLYANTLNYGYVLDDDVVYLKNNIVQQGVKGIGDIFTHSFIYGFTGHNDQSYRPLVQVVYALEKSLFGNSPRMQHFINVGLFALSCVLLFRMLQRMLARLALPELTAGKYKLSIPFLAALLFAAHPVHTECVANIKGLDEVLSFLFSILCLDYLFRHTETSRAKDLFLSVLFFFGSLLCKESALTFLFIIPLTLFFFTSLSVKTILLRCVGFAGAFLLYFAIRKSVLDVVTFQEQMMVINNALAAAQTKGEHLATALFMLGKYIQLLFVPYPLSFDYSYNQVPILSFSDLKAIVSVLFLAILAGYAIWVLLWEFRRPQNERGKNIASVFAWSVLFFFLSISVVSNVFILIGSTMGERFLYTPSLAFCIAVPLIVYSLGNKGNKWNTGNSGIAPPISLYPVLAVLLVFSWLTFDRNKDWKDNASLFAAGVEATPNSSRAQSSMGSVFREQGEKESDPAKRVALFDQALIYYEKAIAILPENTEALYNAGVCYYGKGDKENALKVYERALAVSPDYTSAANNAGVIYFERQDFANAKKYFEASLKYSPNNSDALGNLGAISHNLGHYKEAIDYYKRSLAINPGNQNVRGNLEKAERAMATKK